MNSHNPYTPPATFVADITRPLVPMRKPVSIWLLQVVCALPVVVILVENVRQFGMMDATLAAGMTRAAMIATHVFTLSCALLFIWTIVAAQRRSRAAQWLVWILLGLVLFVVYLDVGASLKEPRVYAVLLPALGLVLCLLYFASLSKRARAWYAPAVEAHAPPTAPP